MTPTLRQLIEGAKDIPIPGWTGYAATEDGQIISYHMWRGKSGRPLFQATTKDGYFRVSMKRQGMSVNARVHQLVCAAFHGPRPSEAHQVRHLDGSRTNNHFTNLAWGTAKENAADRERHGTTAKGHKNGFSALSPEAVIAIRYFYGLGMPPSAMATFIGVERTAITDCALGRTYLPLNGQAQPSPAP